jgi:hypothetical protein
MLKLKNPIGIASLLTAIAVVSCSSCDRLADWEKHRNLEQVLSLFVPDPDKAEFFDAQSVPKSPFAMVDRELLEQNDSPIALALKGDEKFSIGEDEFVRLDDKDKATIRIERGISYVCLKRKAVVHFSTPTTRPEKGPKVIITVEEWLDVKRLK